MFGGFTIIDFYIQEENVEHPLITAVRSRNQQNFYMVELLLLKGAKVNKTNKVSSLTSQLLLYSPAHQATANV